MTYEDDFLRVKGIPKAEDTEVETVSILFPDLEQKLIAESTSFEDLYKGLDEALASLKTAPRHTSFRDLFGRASQDIHRSLNPVDEENIALQYAKERERELELLPDVVSCSGASSALLNVFNQFFSESLNAQYRLDADYGDLTAHRAPSDRENKFRNPIGNTVAIERERRNRTKGRVLHAEDKTNAPDPIADIPLIHTFDKRDPLTGLIPFEDNGARKRKPKKGKTFRYRGAGGGKPGRDMRDLSTRAVEQDSIYSEDRSMSGVPIEAEGRRFLLPKVLPMLTKYQREVLAKAFMAKDKEVIRQVLELVDQAYLDLIE